MRRLTALVLWTVMLSVASADLPATQTNDRRNDLHAAMAVGAEVHPYPLLHSADGRTTVGAVYTRYIRAAKYIWLARQNGREVTIESLPASVTDPAVFVVMQLPPETAGAAAPVMVAIDRPSSVGPAGESVYFGLSPRRRLEPQGIITPAALAKLVGTIPVERAGIVGIFAAEVADRKVIEFGVSNTGPQATHWVSGYVAGPLR